MSNPALPKTPITLNGENYELCFTFAALARAEDSLRKIGNEVNMLAALDLRNVSATSLVHMLYAALLTHQPKMSLGKTESLVTLANMGEILERLLEAYKAAFPEPGKETGKDEPGE